MKIVIPTKGRVHNQLTLNNLPPDLIVETTLVCPREEADGLRRNHPYTAIVEQPDSGMNISEKRKWIIDTAHKDGIEKILMLDDDLRFAVRRTDNPGLFRKANDAEIQRAFIEIEHILSPEVPHAGFAVRGMGIGNSAKEGGWQISGKRMMYSLGYHIPTVLEHAVFGRLATHEDIDVCLQLLLKGYPNAVNFTFVTDQAFGKPGGCSEERTIDGNNADVEKLAEMYPEYVSIIEKLYMVSANRKECRVKWMKAFSDGVENREITV